MYILGYSGFTRSSSEDKGFHKSFAKTHQSFDNLFEFREGEAPFTLFPLGYFGHDASAALIKNGKLIACASEERFTRLKFSLNLAGNTLLPRNAINYCLNSAGITIKDIDAAAHYCNFTERNVKERLNLLSPCITPEEYSLLEKSYHDIYTTMMSREVVTRQFCEMTGHLPEKFISVKHHLAHAASAYFPSGFNDALILTIDGTGELESSVLAEGSDNEIREIQTYFLPASLGALYLIITMYLGFKSLGDEYKVMGLASYGNPSKYRHVFKEIVALEPGGMYSTQVLVNKEFKSFLINNLGPARKQEDPFENRHADIAASLQEILHKAVLHTLEYAKEKTGHISLCVAGGVALNCTLNGVIARKKLFKNIFIQPASGDEGCSAGAAYYAWSQIDNKKKTVTAWKDVYFGPAYQEDQIISILEEYTDRISWKKESDICRKTAEEIAKGKVTGWFQGKMEFGPRALGNRSILGNPAIAEMKDIINEKVKRRESFRPFAPAVLEEKAAEYFDLCGMKNSPYMLFALDVMPGMNERIPAVTHVDGSARVQTVSKNTNPLFWEMIYEFYLISGIPVLLNTSFNVKNEPIVCTPEDAVKCFLSTNIDSLSIGNYFVEKK